MTRMAGPDDREREPYEEEAPRSIFSAMWFRALIVILVFGVIAAVAVPHILDVLSPPPTKQAAKSMTPPPPAPAPTPAPPPAAPPPAAVTAKPATPPPSGTAAVAPPKSPAPVAKPTEAPTKTEPAKKEGSVTTAKTPGAKPAASRGQYWVQVGAFRDAEAAKRLAAKLHADKYQVEESLTSAGGSKPAAAPAAPTGADRYNVFVSGLAPAEINAKLLARGLAAESVAGGVVVKPSLPLREAIALSKDLAVDGMTVQVRRATGASAAAGAPASPSAAAGGGEPLHRVRVGSYPDRAAAAAVAKELESKGYKPFIARGPQ